MARTPVTSTEVERITHERREGTTDLVAVEEPLQIILEHGEHHARRQTPLAVTMRTPGNDADLVTGFLYGEGVIGGPEDLIRIHHCAHAETPDNVVRAVLRDHVVVPSRLLERNLTVTSACGVCGERTLDALSKEGCSRIVVEEGSLDPDAIRRALTSLEGSQAFFRHTGGTHGAALFNRQGDLLMHREDVGRHNALDKLVGAWLQSPPTTQDAFVVVSSRASFELVQKTVRAGFVMLVAIGAASSLAVDTAKRFDLTLVGFARESRFNVYARGERIALEAARDDFLEVEAG
jgi:FdhD protein